MADEELYREYSATATKATAHPIAAIPQPVPVEPDWARKETDIRP
jgi:hypothetical protein